MVVLSVDLKAAFESFDRKILLMTMKERDMIERMKEVRGNEK